MNPTFVYVALGATAIAAVVTAIYLVRVLARLRVLSRPSRRHRSVP